MSHIQIVFGRLAAPNGDLVFSNVPIDRAAVISGTFPPLQVYTAATSPELAAISGTFPPLQVSIQGEAGNAANILGAFPPLQASFFVVGPTAVDIAGTFPPLQAAIVVGPYDEAAITGAFAGLAVDVEAEWDNLVTRYLQQTMRDSHQVAASARPQTSVPFNRGTPQRGGTVFVWQPGNRGGTDATASHQRATPEQQRISGAWQPATRTGADTTSAAQVAQPIDQTIRGGYHLATGIENTINSAAQVGTPRRQTWRSSWQPGTRAGRQAGGGFQASRFRVGRQSTVSRWQHSRRPPQGREFWPFVEPPGPTPCYTPDPNLVLSWPYGYRQAANIIFTCGDYVPSGTITVPVRRVYIVLNTVSLRRASNNVEVPAYGLSLSIDVKSWTYGWDATIPASARNLVESATGPVELKATINGTEYRLLAERIAQERSFGDARVKVSGRGKSAALDAPYSPIGTFANTQQRTAQQLMEDALTVNNVPIGWTIDWGMTDWLVPAGAWSYQGTYIGALQRIAEAAGGYLAPHRTANTIKVRHLYPEAPWDWGSVTPDFVLPADAVVTESIEWVTRPDYNRVFVSGEGQGVLGRVTIDGTAGDLLAPMVVDPLITAVQAARQRGRTILSDTGKQARVGLRLPVLAGTGIIEPGAFVQYNDGATTRRGLVRSTSVRATFPEVWQNLEVETHA